MENTTTPATTTSVGIRYGLLTGLVSIIFSFLQLSFISDPETPLRWLSLVILVVGIVLAHKQLRQLNGGFMSYGQGLGVGTIVTAVSGLLGGVFSYIYLTFIDPEYMQRIMNLTRTRMEEKGLSAVQIDQSMAMMEKFSGGILSTLFAVLGALIMGFVASLIIAAITKNPRPEFE